jgi:hypothetical protein
MSADDLINRIEEAKDKLQSAKDLLFKSEGFQAINELDYTRSDEALDIMHQEMISNLNKIGRMHFMNQFNDLLVPTLLDTVPHLTSPLTVPTALGAGAKAVALAEFAARVRPGGEWDHKPLLQRELDFDRDEEPGAGFYFPIEGNNQYEYNYEIWSNIHYGYIGMAAGFTEAELRAGAIAADGFEYVPSDDLSVQIGIELWEKYGSNLTEEDLRRAILDHTDEYLAVQDDSSVAVIDSNDQRWNGR